MADVFSALWSSPPCYFKHLSFVASFCLACVLTWVFLFASPMTTAVINALSQRYFLQANDQKDLKDWVEALNQASKITVRMIPSFFWRGSVPLFSTWAVCGGETLSQQQGLSQEPVETQFPLTSSYTFADKPQVELRV